MTEAALELIAGYGWAVLLAATFLSCLFLPVPSSFLMLAGGAFASTGDLVLAEVLLAPFAGAVLGDNTGFLLGRFAGSRFTGVRDSKLGKRAQNYLSNKGSIAVYLSTWLFSPLGPYVNFVAGGTAMSWRRFVVADSFGEATWVMIYVGLGYIFVGQIALIADALGSVLGLLTALVVAGFLLKEIVKVARKGAGQNRKNTPDQ